MSEAVMTQIATPTVQSKPLKNSLWWDAFRRIKKDRIAVVSFFIILLYFALGILCSTGVIFTNYALVDQANSYAPPSWSHLFGTDIFGRDVLARAVHAINTSLTVGLFGPGIAIIIGTFLGAIAGYFGGLWDELIVWFSSTLDTIPYILLVTAMSFIMGPGLKTMTIAIGITSWVGLCRLVRAEFMKHREREYIQGAVALGASHFRRIFIHILPNIFHVILINFSLGFIGAVKSEVIFSYIGLGVEAGTPSWGIMITDARLELSREVWWGLAAATIMMFFLVLAFNLFTEALREALDPKLKNK